MLFTTGTLLKETVDDGVQTRTGAVRDASGNFKEFFNNLFDAGGFYWVDVSADGWYR